MTKGVCPKPRHFAVKLAPTFALLGQNLVVLHLFATGPTKVCLLSDKLEDTVDGVLITLPPHTRPGRKQSVSNNKYKEQRIKMRIPSGRLRSTPQFSETNIVLNWEMGMESMFSNECLKSLF